MKNKPWIVTGGLEELSTDAGRVGQGVGARDGAGGGAIGGCMRVVAGRCPMGQGAGGAREGTGGGGIGGCVLRSKALKVRRAQVVHGE